MGLFSKEECCFCNKKVGMLSRKKLRDKKYICRDCEKNCSAFIDISKFDSEYAKQHFEYMKKIVSTVNLASGNRLKYKEIADSVEKRVWN